MPNNKLPALTPVELNRIVTLDEASRLSSLSKDVLRDKFRDKLVHLSERRMGMRVGHALMLNEPRT